MQAPQNLVCTGESQEITLSYAGSNVEKVMGSVTFKNDRQKASVSVYKQDKETRKYLPGGTYGLYAGNDIKAAAGTSTGPRRGCARTAVSSAPAVPALSMKMAKVPAASTSVRCCCMRWMSRKKRRSQNRRRRHCWTSRVCSAGQNLLKKPQPGRIATSLASRCCSAGNGEAMNPSDRKSVV